MKLVFNETPYMNICLCKRCAAVYYDDKDYWIERSEPYQENLEQCDFCRQYLGIDYNIWKLSNVRIAKSHNCRGDQL